MSAALVTVAETGIFQRQAAAVWSEPERLAFIDYIAGSPEAGDLIPDTGGIRKVRWARAGSGKRGGVRVIYYYCDATMPLYLLLVYAKARQESWSPLEKRRARDTIAAIREQHLKKGLPP